VTRPSAGPLRIGLIGAGMIGTFRARALGAVKDARLSAVADADPDRARRLAHRANATVYDNGGALASAPDIDAVILSTPPALHEPLGLACLRAGKHLLVEKPLAVSVEACENLVEAAERAGLCLATGFTLRQTPAARLARRLVDEGAIGAVVHVRAFHGHRGGPDFGPAWVTDATVSGGGTLMDNGIHVIDLARWFLGDVGEVSGLAAGSVWHKPGCEDNSFLLMRATSGAIGCVHSSWTEWRGYGYRVEVYGAHGFMRFGYPPLWLTWGQGEPGMKMRTRRRVFAAYQVIERLRGWQWSLIETLRLDIEDWVAAIRAGRPAPASGRDGLEAVRAAKSAHWEVGP
jgi:predicted dehydrogenase